MNDDEQHHSACHEDRTDLSIAKCAPVNDESRFGVAARITALSEPPKNRVAKNQEQDKERDKDKEDELRDSDRRTGNSTKAQDCCDDSNDQEEKRPVKHRFILCGIRLTTSAEAQRSGITSPVSSIRDREA